MSDNRIRELRERMDELNGKLLELLNERAAIGRQIGEIKKAEGLPIHDPVRENEMLDRLAGLNAGPLDDAAVRHLFKEVFKATRQLQQSIAKPQ